MSNIAHKIQNTMSSNGGENTKPNNGPHKSKLLNKLDPRVDSDADNRGRQQAMEGTQGPHHSNIANKLDPRVDSDAAPRSSIGSHPLSTFHRADPLVAADIDNRARRQSGQGPHQSNIANKLDPRVDSSSVNHQTTAGSSYNGPSTAAPRAGPHRSDLANKLDPRVDSDLDHRQRVHPKHGIF